MAKRTFFKRDRWGRFAGTGRERRNARIHDRIAAVQNAIRSRREYVRDSGDRGTAREQARDRARIAKWNNKIGKLRLKLR